MTTADATASITDDNIRELIRYLLRNNKKTHPVFGHIEEWDVSRVTDMSGLFLHRHEGEFVQDSGLSRKSPACAERPPFWFRNYECSGNFYFLTNTVLNLTISL